MRRNQTPENGHLLRSTSVASSTTPTTSTSPKPTNNSQIRVGPCSTGGLLRFGVCQPRFWRPPTISPRTQCPLKSEEPDIQVLQSPQRSEVCLLPLRLPLIAGTNVEPGREVTYAVDGVFRKEGLAQFVQVKPPKWSVLESAVVEIETVDVQIGDQLPPPPKDRDRPVEAVSTLPPKRIGGSARTLTSASSTVNTFRQDARPTANSPVGDQPARTRRRLRLRKRCRIR